MKNIFATIEYVAEKILEAITGHKNDEQAHPNLSEQINVLSTTHGYINSKEMKDFNVCVKNGKYTVYFNGDGVEQHAPPNIVTGDNTFAVDVTQQSDTVLVQEICGIYGPNQGRKFYRINTFGTWTDWDEVATTTKTNILVTPQPGYEVLYQKSYRINGITYLSVRVRKTDRSEFGIHQHSLFTIPHNVNRSALASTPYGDSNLELLANGVVNTIAWNNSIAYAWVGASGVYGIEVTGRLI